MDANHQHTEGKLLRTKTIKYFDGQFNMRTCTLQLKCLVNADKVTTCYFSLLVLNPTIQKVTSYDLYYMDEISAMFQKLEQVLPAGKIEKATTWLFNVIADLP